MNTLVGGNLGCLVSGHLELYFIHVFLIPLALLSLGSIFSSGIAETG